MRDTQIETRWRALHSNFFCHPRRGAVLPIHAPRHAEGDEGEESKRLQHRGKVAILGGLGSPPIPKETGRETSGIEEVGKEARRILPTYFESEFSRRQVEGDGVGNGPHEKQRHRQRPYLKRQEGREGKQAGDEHKDQYQRQHQRSLFERRKLLVDAVAHEEEPDDGAARAESSQGSRVAVREIECTVEKWREKIHEELGVRKDDNLGHKH
mmetsp:Transcript_33478/g.71460  ORF Transcript_33478/g.71460 Transcript_33478/m.71460 type:complete len:211 (+) Transcript_33478:227-859(+)